MYHGNFRPMSKSSDLYNDARSIFPGGVNSPVRYYEPYPRFIERGSGSEIWDVDGRRYVDYCLAFGPLILGHAHPSIQDALIASAKSGINFGAPTEVENNLGRMITDNVPAIEKIRFASSGTEATMHAIRLSRSYTKRKIIIKVEGGYHGSHDYALIKAGSGALTHGVPSSPGVPEEVGKTVMIAEYNNIESFSRIINEHRKEGISAVIIEPVLGNTGVIPPRETFLKELAELLVKNDILLIFDEVITGFRFKFGCYSSIAGVRPDITTLGKIIGGGLPIGAIGGRDDIMNLVAPEGKTYLAGTFSGNRLSMMGGFNTLKELKNCDYQSLNRKVDKITKEISDVLSKYDSGTINSSGSMFQIFFGSNSVEKYSDVLKVHSKRFLRFFNFALDHGLYIPPSTFETNFVSFVHKEDQLEKFVEVLEMFLKYDKS